MYVATAATRSPPNCVSAVARKPTSYSSGASMNHTSEMVVSVAAGTEGDDTAEERDDCGRGEELTGAIP